MEYIGFILLAVVVFYIAARLLWMAFFRSLNDFLNTREEELTNGRPKKKETTGQRQGQEQQNSNTD